VLEGASDGLDLGFRCVQVAGPAPHAAPARRWRQNPPRCRSQPITESTALTWLVGREGSHRPARSSAHRARRPLRAHRDRCPNCDRDVATLQIGPRVFANRPARRSPHNRGMPLQIHIQPDPDHLCQTCGGPSELTSYGITRWLGNKMARDVSPPTPRCVDPWCQSRRPRHLRQETCPWGCGVVAAEGRCEQKTNGGIGTRRGLPGR